MGRKSSRFCISRYRGRIGLAGRRSVPLLYIHYTQEKHMNPFELRYDLLKTSKEFLTEQYNAQLKAWELLDEAGKKALENAPKFPTMHEIVDNAIEMNKFISNAVETQLVDGVKRINRITAVF
jgi:hypothetical protein